LNFDQLYVGGDSDQLGLTEGHRSRRR